MVGGERERERERKVANYKAHRKRHAREGGVRRVVGRLCSFVIGFGGLLLPLLR
jgi:hypothetical protein